MEGAEEQMSEVSARMVQREGALGRRTAIRYAAGVAALGVGSVALAACGVPVPGALAVPSAGGTLNPANAQVSTVNTMVSASGGTYNLVAQPNGNVTQGQKADGISYLFTTATGDGVYSCKVASQGSGNAAGAVAGLMARQSGDAGSPFVGVFITPKNGGQFLWRNTYQTAANAWPMPIAIGVAAPIWLQLTKKGTNWTVAYSLTGKSGSYENQQSQAVTFAGTSYLVGLAAGSGASAAAIDVFSDLQGFKKAPWLYLDVNATNTKANSSTASSSSSK